MGIKHDILTEKEIDDYQLDSRIDHQIQRYLENNSAVQANELRILDWGCGRGRAVLKLLEKGYSSYGTDIDKDVMENGYSLFREYGYSPENHFKRVSNLNEFPDGFFHFIFSEQVFEHVKNIEAVIQMQARLLAPGGIGCHLFPAARMIRECHLNMPIAHWFPKNRSRKLWISFMMLLSKKPEVTWPETENTSFSQEVNVYYNYLNNRTFYRDNRKLKQLFEQYGFEANYLIKGIDSPKRKFIPDFLLHNGFPDQQVCFVVQKK